MNIFEICEHYFCCPNCKANLKAHQFADSGDGFLNCLNCRNNFMIMDNIPIMLAHHLIDDDAKEEFLTRHPQLFGHFSSYSVSGWAEDAVKNHQVKTWGNQYRSRAQRGIRVDRVFPPTSDAFLHDLFYSSNKKMLWSRIDKMHNRNVFLEVGCGEGAFTSSGMRKFGLYLGLDISYQAVLNCYSKYPYKNCLFLVGDAENLPLKDSIVDACGAQWLFEHLAHPEAAAKEMYRILSPGGIAYIDTNHKYFSCTFRWLQMTLSPRKYWARMTEAGHSHDRFFGRLQLQGIFRGAGFSLLETKLCYFLADMLISQYLLTPLLQKIAGAKQERKNKDGPVSQIVTLLDFQEKSCNLDVTSSKREQLITIINFVLDNSRYLFMVDRLLELLGQGESIVLLAERPFAAKNVATASY